VVLLSGALAAGLALASMPQPPAVVLRGDYEVPDAVVVGLADSFPETLEPLVAAVAAHGPVYLVAQRGAGRRRVERWVARQPSRVRESIVVVEHRADSPWVRDYGPLQLRGADGSSAWLDGTYPERPIDDAFPDRLGRRLGVPVTSIPWSLDGGAVASNGEGLCVSTRAYFEAHGIPAAGAVLREQVLPAIGCRSLVLVDALPDDATHHVDLFVQFLARDVVAVARIDPLEDPEVAAVLDRAANSIVRAAAKAGTRVRLVRPAMGLELDGSYRSYLNGLRLGGAFLMPTYERTSTPAEQDARRVLEAALPGLDVVRIPAAEMIDLGGAIHCVTLGVFVAERGRTARGVVRPR
jgi:agmatine/peptidylarginine deiminase